jgi:hypothetical protein
LLFERTLPTEPTSIWPFSQAPQPDAIVVNLGTNDFLADHDGDGVPDPIELYAFEDAYAPFLARIRAVHPSAPVVLTTSPMLTGTMAETANRSLARIVERRRRAGDRKMVLLQLEEQGDRLGCDSHPNARMHEVLALQVLGAVAPLVSREQN